MLVHVISDVARRGDSAFARLLDALSGNPPDVFQIREKGSCDREILRLVERVLTRLGNGVLVLVNGRPDLARAARAGGVQLPEDGLPPARVRAAFPGLHVGVSRHAIAAVPLLVSGADHVVLAPIYGPSSKPLRGQPLGPEALDDLPAVPTLPVHALGGLTVKRVASWPEGRRRRVHGVAGIGLFWDAADPARVVADLRALAGAA